MTDIGRRRLETDHIDFNCPILKGVAQVSLQYRRHPGTTKKIPINFACAQCDRCGIGEQTAPGTWVYHWERCPAHTQFNK